MSAMPSKAPARRAVSENPPDESSPASNEPGEAYHNTKELSPWERAQVEQILERAKKAREANPERHALMVKLIQQDQEDGLL